jgi:hypothetical protein
MLFLILKWSIISLALIILVHHLYTFLMNTLTVPKIKDLVNKPKEQYKDLFQTMQQSGMQGNNMQSNMQSNMQGNKKTNADMADELSSFLNDLKKKSPIDNKKGDTIFPQMEKNSNEVISSTEHFSSGQFSEHSGQFSGAGQFSGTGFSAF